MSVAAIGAILLLVCGCLSRSKRQEMADQCTANLKEITLGFNLWLQDNEVNNLPWGQHSPSEIEDFQRPSGRTHGFSLATFQIR